jgi:DNA-binding XRE family transcriptional regulator
MLHFCVMELRIKQVAKQKGVTVDKLAAMVGVSRRTIYNWINGNVTMTDLLNVAIRLDCSFYELIEPTDGLTLMFDEHGKFKGLTK